MGFVIRHLPILILVSISFISFEAMSYVGPSLGTGVIGVLLGVGLAILMALMAVLYYPLKKLLRKLGVLKPEELPGQSDKDNAH